MINLVAEDHAIEDTIYHLHRALSTGRIDLERFLRVSMIITVLVFSSSPFLFSVSLCPFNFSLDLFGLLVCRFAFESSRHMLRFSSPHPRPLLHAYGFLKPQFLDLSFLD
jgi:hypothetical protein